ncbi:IS1634 family transposase [Nonomuraea ferruginea]
MTRILASTRRSPFTERVLFALVANRALDASSKLAASHWIGRNAHIDGLPACSDDACYRAMDWLHQVQNSVERKVFDQVATLLNLEVDLLFFDTTSTYFEIDEGDEPIARDQRGVPLPDPGNTGEEDGSGPVMKGFRTRGKSKDHRDDLPQIVIGMAVTRDGIPVRIWSWPGNTTDTALIRQVKDDMRDWTLSKIVWVGDRGFASADNRRYLRQGDHHYIIGERLRSGSAEAKAALSRQGRYQDVAENLKVKEVRIGETDRFVICFNPDGAERDAAIRERLVTQLEELIAGTDTLSATKRAELRGVISTKPGLNRYLRTTPQRAAAHRRRQGQGRDEPGRQVPAALLRPQAASRGHRPRLQATAGGRAGLARHETGHRPAPGLSPPRGTHPRPRHLVLAGPAADPHHRDHHRRHLEAHPRRVRPPDGRHLHRPDRHLPPARRTDQAPARHPGQTRHPDPKEDRRSYTRHRRLTSHDAGT